MAGTCYDDGASYDLKADKWEKLPKAPIEPRFAHSAVWTGKEMIIWGGKGENKLYADGASYNPKTRKWKKSLRHQLKQNIFILPSGQARR
jgi:hypothetical protein